MKEMKFETKVIHVGGEPDPTTGAIMPPIYQTSTYVQSSPESTRGTSILAHITLLARDWKSALPHLKTPTTVWLRPVDLRLQALLCTCYRKGLKSSAVMMSTAELTGSSQRSFQIFTTTSLLIQQIFLVLKRKLVLSNPPSSGSKHLLIRCLRFQTSRPFLRWQKK